MPTGRSSSWRGAGSVLTQYIVGGLAGYFTGDIAGALGGAGVVAMGRAALDALKRAGIERTDQLLTEALLNPELAKTLLMRATSANRPIIAQRLASQIGTLAAAAGAETQLDESSRPTRTRQPAQVAPTAPAPTLNPAMPPPVWGSLAPGGAMLGRTVP